MAALIHPGSLDTKTTLQAELEDRTVNVLDNFLDIGRSIYAYIDIYIDHKLSFY